MFDFSNDDTSYSYTQWLVDFGNCTSFRCMERIQKSDTKRSHFQTDISEVTRADRVLQDYQFVTGQSTRQQ